MPQQNLFYIKYMIVSCGEQGRSYTKQMSLCVRKPTIWVPTKSDTNRAVQSQKMVRGWKFSIWKVEELYYPCSENKGADQLGSYFEADLPFVFAYADCCFPMWRLKYEMKKESNFLLKLGCMLHKKYHWLSHYLDRGPHGRLVCCIHSSWNM